MRPTRNPYQRQHVHLARGELRHGTVHVLCGGGRRTVDAATDSATKVSCPSCRGQDELHAVAVERRLRATPCPLHNADVRTYVATSETGQCLTCWATGLVLPCTRCQRGQGPVGCAWCNGTGYVPP